MEHLGGLNPEQKEAVTSIDGPLLVLAGAGAGKTRVITHRILHIIKQGVEPAQVLAITFTNKAAAEMRTRVLALLHTNERGRGEAPFVSTFHSLGLLLIKENAKLLGYKASPAIYDRADSLRAMKQALKESGHEDLEARMVLGAVSRTKGEGLPVEAFAESAHDWRDKAIAAAWRRYEASLRAEGALDFDDLLLKAVELLKKHPEVCERYRARWRYIHIDEYQDTNAVQEQLAELLLGPERNICVVGDPDQTIYGWRGAAIENILHFERKYKDAKVVVLEENYRSSENILHAANTLIENNMNRPQKILRTKNPPGEMISLYIAGDGGDEASFVARKVSELVREGHRPEEFAVLYRANFQSRALEEKFLEEGIPYQVLGTRFFERKEVKDVLSFIRAARTEGVADLGRVLDTVPGIGKVTKLKILSGAEETLPPKMRERIGALRAALAHIKEQAALLAPSALVRAAIHKSGIAETLKADKLEGAERLLNLEELVSLAARYDAYAPEEGLEHFLESAALASDQDELKEEKSAVRLMTVHAAKGLEFPYVFIVGLEEGLFPYAREEEGQKGLEEERRLMYVALTRGKKKVFLSYAMMRTLFGTTDVRTNSQFLNELPGEVLKAESPEKLGKTIYLD